MSTIQNTQPAADPLAGMEDGALVLNENLSVQEATGKDPAPMVDDPPQQDEADAAAGEDTAVEGEEKPKKPNKTPRDARIKKLASENKTLKQRLADFENGVLQPVAGTLKNMLPPEEIPGNTTEFRDAAPDPTDLTKYRLGDLDPAYTRDLIRHEFRQEQFAERQRQAQQEVRAQQERHTSEILGKVSELAEKGAAVHADYVETVVQPFLEGRVPLEEATFIAATEAEHGFEVLRDLAADRNEAARVASMTPFQQLRYVDAKSNEIAARNKPRLPQASPPPGSQARGTGGRFGVRGDEDDLDAIEKAIYRRG